MSNYMKWLDYGLDVAKIALSGTPAGAVVAVIDEVVKNTQDIISNNSVIKTLKSMAKSKGNDLTPGKIKKIEQILEAESIYYKHLDGSVVELLATSDGGKRILYNEENDDTYIVDDRDFKIFYGKVEVNG